MNFIVYAEVMKFLFKPIFYNIYVDDTFLIFQHPCVKPFFDYVNLQHNSIQFTIELKYNNSLSFPNGNVTKSNSRFLTSVYQKHTFTGLSASFFSFCSFQFKLNGLQTLLHRGFHICSTYHAMHTEFEFSTIFSCLMDIWQVWCLPKSRNSCQSNTVRFAPERDSREVI
jgi:hypothetical protein